MNRYAPIASVLGASLLLGLFGGVIAAEKSAVPAAADALRKRRRDIFRSASKSAISDAFFFIFPP